MTSLIYVRKYKCSSFSSYFQLIYFISDCLYKRLEVLSLKIHLYSYSLFVYQLLSVLNVICVLYFMNYYFNEVS